MARDPGSLSPQPILLGLLMSEPRHGYELYQQLNRQLGRVWQIGQSQLYAQLKQIEEDGLVTAHTEVQGSRPPRKVYHLTPEGRAAFMAWVCEPSPYLRHLRVEFLARLYFYRQLSLPGMERLVARQKAVCEAQIERFDRLAAEAEDGFRRLVLEFRRGQLAAVVDWLDRYLELLQ